MLRRPPRSGFVQFIFWTVKSLFYTGSLDNIDLEAGANSSGEVDLQPYNHQPKDRIETYLEAFYFLYQFDDDTILSIIPGLKHASISSILGVKEIICGIETTDEKIIIRTGDIDKIPKPPIAVCSAVFKWFEMAKYLKENTEGNM